MNIGRRYLLPKQMKHNGLKEHELKMRTPRSLTSCATTRARRAVRSLEREIAKICRKAVKQLAAQQEGREACGHHAEEPR